MPVLGHQGEPRNAWLPLDPMTIRGDREYFAEHPQYHMAQHPEWPATKQQIAARDRMLDKHPGLTFVGVHLASLEWDVDRIADFLRRYPNASVDLAARLSHLELQASLDRDKVRQFFIEFQDRILYGSDFGRGRDQSDAEFAAEAHEGWLADWHFLSGRRRAALDRVRRAVSGARAAARGARESLPRNARRIFRRRGANCRERAMMVGAALLLLTSAAAVQGDGIRLDFDGQDAKPRRRDVGHRRPRSGPSPTLKRS